jgi:hypothetical protein
MGGKVRIKSLAEIMEEMRRHYKRRPGERRGWRVLGTKDQRGYADLFFYGPKAGLWQIKGELKSPYELMGAGARIGARRVDDEIRELMGQGRPLPFGMMSPHPKRKDTAIIASGLGRYLESSERMRAILSSKQRELDFELRSRLEKLRHKFGLDVAYG